MRSADADALTSNNLAYREPALYDSMIDVTTFAVDIRGIANQARSALDLGCGTGRLLGELFRCGVTCTGIDLQPGLIAWAQREHPALWLEVGDLRSVRLDATFDLIICVGNTLSYLHTETDLAAAMTTAATHAHPGTLLAIATVTGEGRDTTGSSEITTVLGPATVNINSLWDPPTDILTTRRTWQFHDGRTEHDTMQRRFWNTATIDHHARSAGFRHTPNDTTELTYCATFTP